MFECDFPDCFRFYENLENLSKHKYYSHGIPMFLPNNLKPDDVMMGNMYRYQMGLMQNPVFGNNNNPTQNINQPNSQI